LAALIFSVIAGGVDLYFLAALIDLFYQLAAPGTDKAVEAHRDGLTNTQFAFYERCQNLILKAGEWQNGTLSWFGQAKEG
jgi:hypothetical protein